ncbi:hypothetical protein IX95_07070 [Vibrio sp. B183]|uniref:hypothetical protein n=1 Tax=Vibrio sp. B183 TaxID=1526762 RepID=UPI0004FF7D23|nr:hypothetical protein [Vibrio sp. B183]KFI12708.1 hypothetical protein IX95_07070 [Vibrio sp. B183]
MFKEIYRVITDRKAKTETLKDTMYYYASIVNQPAFKNTFVTFVNDENKALALEEIKAALISQREYALMKREADQRHINLIRQGYSPKEIETHVNTLEMNVKKVIAMRGNDTVYFGLTANGELIVKPNRHSKEGVLATVENIKLTTLKIKTM